MEGAGGLTGSRGSQAIVVEDIRCNHDVLSVRPSDHIDVGWTDRREVFSGAFGSFGKETCVRQTIAVSSEPQTATDGKCAVSTGG